MLIGIVHGSILIALGISLESWAILVLGYLETVTALASVIGAWVGYGIILIA